MDENCEKCELKSLIDEKKGLLDKKIEEGHNLLSSNLLKLSQYLDKIIYECIKCSTKTMNIGEKRRELDDIFGTHSTFYYYGQHHLFVNMFDYINEGLKNDELVYLFMEENMYNGLLEFLKDNHVDTSNVKFKNVRDLIQGNRKGGLKALKDEIYKIGSTEEVRNYKGIRWIGQPSYAIQLNSEEDFLSFEKNLDEALKDINASLLCIYDVYDYINEGNIINEKVIEESLDTHIYILKDSCLEVLS